MPYFLVIPAYLLFLALCLVSIAIAYVRPEWKQWVPALAWGLIGATVGAVALNALVVLLWLLCSRFIGEGTTGSSIAIVVAFLMFLGPLIGTSIGILGGYATGFALRRPRATSH